MERTRKKIDKKHFYDEYDKKIKDNPALEVWERRILSFGHVRFGNSEEDKSAIRFFSSLLKEFNIPGTPDCMITDLAAQRFGVAFQGQTAGEVLARYSQLYAYDADDIDFLTKCAEHDLSTKWLGNQVETMSSLAQLSEQIQSGNYPVIPRRK